MTEMPTTSGMPNAMRQDESISFGELLRRYRVAAGLSREALAERAGLSARGIQDLERGVNRAPRADTVALLLGALALAPEERAALEATVTRFRRPYVPSSAPERGGNAAPSHSEQTLPTGRFLGALPDNRLVGRDGELSQVLEAVEAAVNGAGRLVMFIGEPGVGKTRLAQEVTLHLRDRAFLIATGRCYEPQRTVPYYPFLDALAGVYAAAPEAVRVQAPHRWPYLALLLPDEIRSMESISFEGLDEQQRLLQAVTGFLAQVVEVTPLAVLIDDLHWADSASLDLLQYLTRHTRASRLLLIGTYRDVEVERQHPLRQALRDLNRERLVKRVAVRRLGQDGTAALIASTLDDSEVSAEFAELVHRHTEGNPFFTDEVLRALIDRGDLYREDGGWGRRALEEIEVPESIRDAIGERLSHLAVRTQDLLRQASVLGQAFGFEDLHHMSGTAEEEVEEALDEAMTAGLIWDQGGDAYEFTHALIQQTLYQELSSRQRRRVHQAAGEALEKPRKRRQKLPAAELARHFLEADDAQRALRYALLAGNEAVYLGAWSEAERHFREAVHVAREIGDRERELEAMGGLAGSLFVGGQYQKSLAIADAALPMVEASGSLSGLSNWCRASGRFRMNAGELDQARAYLQRAIQLADRVGDDRALASAVLAQASMFFFRGEWETARLHLNRVVELTGGRDVEDAVWSHVEPPKLAVAEGSYEAAIWIHVDLAKLALAEGSYEAAASHVKACLQQAEKISEPWPGLYGQWQRAQLDLLEGHPEAALARIEHVRDDPRFGMENLIEVLPVLAEVYLTLGRLDRAEEVAAECVREARRMNYRLEIPVALRAQGMVLSEQRRWEEAVRVLEEAISSAREIPYPYAEARALHEYGSALAAMRSADDTTLQERAGEVLSQAVAIFQGLGAKKDMERSEQALADITRG